MATEISAELPVSTSDALSLVALYGVAVAVAAVVLVLTVLLVLRLTVLSKPGERPKIPTSEHLT